MALDGRLITNRDDFPVVLEHTARGWRGERSWIVEGTADPETAILWEGLPKIGSSWSDRLPELVVVKRGTPVSLAGDWVTDGCCRVPISYETPSATTGFGNRVPTAETKSWTDVELSSTTINIRYPLERPEFAPPFFPINNGDGVDIPTARIIFRVTVHLAANQQVDFARLNALARPAKINHAPLRFPRIYGRTQTLEVARGQAMYLGFDKPEVVDKWLRMVHVFEIAETFDYVWQRENAKGEAGGVVVDKILADADFSGLW